ncbi:MAG: DUF3455 domain-containing protein [Ferruginibacter sp.]|nr:DUF3455 domain-containing protein [Ferruginibacter sp.]
MYSPHSRYSKFFLLSAVLLTVAMACTHDKEAGIVSPGQHIHESEKLVIPASIDLPGNLPGGNTRIATFFAEGIQKYKSQQKAGSNPPEFEWVFVAPEATLYNSTNAKVGTHSAGPAWQLSASATDSIFGQQFSPPKSAASPDPVSIDWLQLMPKTGKSPTGVFANVSYIQRIATRGGKAPATLPAGAGETIDVKYTAVYRFTKKNP